MGKSLGLSALAARLTCIAVGIVTAAAAAAATKTPLPPPQLCISGNSSGQTCAQTAAPRATGAIKWHPGHYMASNGIHKPGMATNTFQFELDAAGAVPEVQGWRGIYNWAALETDKGKYDFSVIDAELAMLKTKYSTPKRIGLLISTAAWGKTTPGTTVLPQYLLNDPANGKGTDGVHYGYWSTGSSLNAAVWRPAVMDRFIALIQALGAHFNNEPNFEVLTLPETSGAVTTTAPDFSDAALLTQLKRLVTAAVAAFPNTNVTIQNNWMGSIPDTGELVRWTLQAGAGQNGPDIWGKTAVDKYGDKAMSWGQECVLGINPAAGCTTDLRGQIPVIHDIEEPEMDGIEFKGLGAPYTPLDLYNNADGNLHASHIFWTYLGGSGPGNWKSVVAFISQTPITHPACPGSYKAVGCNTN